MRISDWSSDVCSSDLSRLNSSGTGAISFTSNAAISFSSPDTAQTIRLGGTNTDNNSLATQITNNGLGITSFTKHDAGTWILTNPNSSSTGITTISGGVLDVDKLANGGITSRLGASTSDAPHLVISNSTQLTSTGSASTNNPSVTF